MSGYMDKPVWQQNIPTKLPSSGVEFEDPVGLHNEQYGRLLSNYFKCVTYFLNEYTEPVMLEKQLVRRDLDTVCAYELYQMKKGFTQTNVLDMSEFLKHKKNPV